MSLPREKIEVQNVKNLEGTLSYLSPEQTGRMNRGISYLSDYYSLGVTLYQMFTGKLPFLSTDPMELIYSHIVKMPISPHEVDEHIPLSISKMIMKLLAKNPEDRYKSLNSLKEDLQRCLTELQKTGEISDFPIAMTDRSQEFTIPEKLYGREKEIQQLVETFFSVTKGPSNLMLVTGYAGIGKSSLVHELHKPAIEFPAENFITGKFEQLKHNIPYSAFIQALDFLMMKILSESEDKIKEWKKTFLEALGPNGIVLTDILPSLVNIIGPQPPVPLLEPSETQFRFKYVVQNFIRSLGSSDHPLVIFLDDLQWADLSSLNFLETFFKEGNSTGILIIAAYRENEVHKAHPLNIMLDNLRNANIHFSKIVLQPLEIEHVEQLLADTLYQEISNVKSLAKICHQKTGGNPFFLIQFLKTLNEEGLINFNMEFNSWHWNIDSILQRKHTENVIDLLIDKIHKFPTEIQSILKIASCIGIQFDLQLLSNILHEESIFVSNLLWKPIQEELIYPLDEDYKLMIKSESTNPRYIFSHDRVQQAAHELMNEESKKETHLKIGFFLQKNIPTNKSEEFIFQIVNHLNMGLDLIKDKPTKLQIAELNLKAGQIANASVANETALNYFQTGISLLNVTDWEENYNLMLDLYTNCATAAFVCKDYAEAMHLGEIVLDHAASVLDQVKVYELKIHIYIANLRFKDAIETIKMIATKLGIQYPKKITKFHLLLEFFKSKIYLIGKTEKNLLKLPAMTNPYMRAVSNIISNTQQVAYYYDPLFCLYNILKLFIITIRYGYNTESPVFYAGYGVFLTSTGNLEQGYYFGQLGYKLLEQHRMTGNEPTLLMAVGNLVNHWKLPLRKTIPTLITCYIRSMEVGNIGAALLIAYIYPSTSFISGLKLNEVKGIINKFKPIVHQYHFLMGDHVLAFLEQAISNLEDKNESPAHLNGKYYKIEERSEELVKTDNGAGLLHLYFTEMQLNVIFNDYQLAYSTLVNVKKYQRFHISGTKNPFIYYYHSLILLALWDNFTWSEKIQHFFTIYANQRKLKKFSKACPENNLYKYYLVKAEILRVMKQDNEAMILYDKAIELAKQYEFMPDQALANELAGMFFLSRNREKIAKVYLKDACYTYERWGATAKSNQLYKRYSSLISKEPEPVVTLTTTTTKIETIAEKLDAATAIKASQAIASELVFSNFLKKMMSIVVENAGAKKAYLLLKTNEDWAIEASIEEGEIKVLKSQPIDILPQSVLHYVLHSKNPVLIDDAAKPSPFSADPYIEKNHPKSILCLPLLNQGELTAILYLENNISTGVFTESRFSLLKMLSSQIVISMNNARLYDQVNALNLAYAKFVPHEFLQMLKKKDILDIHLNDHIQQDMTVMFCDIRNFTRNTEKLSPEDSFNYINTILMYLVPIIQKHRGFIDKFIGDAIMALYINADDALQASIEIILALQQFNVSHPELPQTQVGIGLNSGHLMLGIVGSVDRMNVSVISDTVNVASRIEDLTKQTASPLIITEDTYTRLQSPLPYNIGNKQKILLRGRSDYVTIYEVTPSNT